MELQDLAGRSGEWLRGSGPESDIVISSRIRLARNLAEYPFIRKATEHDRVAIEKLLRDRIAAEPKLSDLLYVDVSELASLDRQFLVERQLISREHADSDGARAVAIDSLETCSLMINEEDHLRIQVMHSGLDLDKAWDQISRIDDLVEDSVTFAYHQRPRVPDRLPDQCRYRNARERDAAPAGSGNYTADRKGFFAVCKRLAWPYADCTEKGRRRWGTFTK